METSLSSPRRVAGPNPLPLLFFFLLLSLVLPYRAGIFLVLSDFQGLLLVFSWALWEENMANSVWQQDRVRPAHRMLTPALPTQP